MSPTPCQTCLVPELRSPEALILRVDRCCSQPTWRKAAERQRYGELLRAVKSRSWLGRPSGLELRTVEMRRWADHGGSVWMFTHVHRFDIDLE